MAQRAWAQIPQLSFFWSQAYPEDAAFALAVLQSASAAYTLPEPEHDNGEGRSTSARQCVRVVMEMDSKSIGLCPQGFESPRCRSGSAVNIARDKRLCWRRSS